MDFPKHPLEVAAAWREEGIGVAIATVMATFGSSPRPAGSQLVINERGEFAGSVSAGCVESTVIDAAQGVLATGTPKILEMGVEEGAAWEVGLSCGGEISILIARLEPGPNWLDKLLHARQRQEPAVVQTHLESGDQRFFSGWSEGAHPSPPSEIEQAAQRALDEARCLRETTAEGELFFHPSLPRPLLVVVGAVHIAEPLMALAHLCDFECTVVEPRKAFAQRDAFSRARILQRWPDEALRTLEIGAHAAVVALSHDPKIDDPALVAALRQGAFYVGALGSRRTHANRCTRLRELGLSEHEIERVHAPVGLAIGALSPAEIAVSILAEVIATHRDQSVAASLGRQKATTTPSNATPP